MAKTEHSAIRPFARSIAQELTAEEIENVSGGLVVDPNKCHRTLTGCEQTRDGQISCGDTDSC